MIWDKQKIGIVGIGFVGGAIKAAMEDVCNLVLVDSDPTRGTHQFKDLLECEAIFVCVPSPQGDDGRCDTSILESVLDCLQNFTGVIISKCTASPEVYTQLNEKYPNLVHAPEFLVAATAVRDYKEGKFAFIGGRVQAYLNQAASVIKLGQRNLITVHHCTIAEAAMAKYTINTFLATKVVWMNEMYQLCEKMGIDYRKVVAMAKADPRIGDSHLRVPGPDDSFGFGGACFPKDTAALLKIAEDYAVQLNVLDSAVKKNTLLRLTEPK
jgi:UDPglucose 6-dehydrogenase